MHRWQGRVRKPGAKSGQGIHRDRDSASDRLQDDLPVTEALVLLEAQHRYPRRSGVLCEAVKVGLGFLGPQEATEARTTHFDAAVPEGLAIVLRIAQATQVCVLDASFG